MPTYTTPEPISVTIDLSVGDVRIVASDRTDTVVTVTPADPASNTSIHAAQRVRVEHSPGTLEIRQNVPWHQKFSLTADIGVVTVVVELPVGSNVRGRTAMGAVQTEGRLGEFEFTSDHGDFQLGEVTNTLRVKGTTGSIQVERAHADVDARTTTGTIRVAEVVRGSVELTTSVGQIEVGVREGSAANLDVRTKLGRIRNTLTSVGSPARYADTVKVRARTNLDDIIVHRS
jgi:putative adhesin